MLWRAVFVDGAVRACGVVGEGFVSALREFRFEQAAIRAAHEMRVLVAQQRRVQFLGEAGGQFPLPFNEREDHLQALNVVLKNLRHPRWVVIRRLMRYQCGVDAALDQGFRYFPVQRVDTLEDSRLDCPLPLNAPEELVEEMLSLQHRPLVCPDFVQPSQFPVGE